ncbi:hypothetical protein QUF74_17090 [Candidatus Halobeggiatoa sp. HSG11]|nr:hypothetical protein [Candidatus Halobeggiatoa sp. HSG11]
MRYNKTLGVAIASILSGGIGISAHAGNLEFKYNGGTTLETAAEIISTEIIDDKGNPQPSSTKSLGEVSSFFEFKRKANIIYSIYIDYTLIGGEFSANLDGFNTSHIDWATNSTTNAQITKISGGSAGDTTVRFLLQAEGTGNTIKATDSITGDMSASTTTKDVLKFNFTPDSTSGLINSGGTVKLKAEWGAANTTFVVDDSATVTLFQSKADVTIAFTPDSPAAQIDVTEGSKKFIDGISETAITLGTLKIDDTTSGTTIIPGSGANTVTGSLYIENGPFQASTTEAGGMVFLGIKNDTCTFTEDTVAGDNSGDVLGVLDGNNVLFTLAEEHVEAMEGNEVDICVVVAEENTTDINPTDQRPSASLTLNYVDADKDITSTGTLAITKRNGTACTIYNVPHKQASDLGFYRFINKTTKEAMVLGSLTDRDGTVHLKDQELGTAPAKGTLVVTAEQLHDYAVAQTGAAEEKPWKGRALLSINSDSTDMDVYGLLRAKNTKDVTMNGIIPTTMGPLINISAGASGNGCD